MNPHITCLRTEADRQEADRQAMTYGKYVAVLDENARLKGEIADAQKRQHMSDLNYDALEKQLAAANAEIAALREALETVATLYENAEYRAGTGAKAVTAYDMRCVARAALDAAKGKP